MRPCLIPLLAMAIAADAMAAPAAPLRDPFVRPASAIPAPPDAAPETAPRLRALVLNAAGSLANIDGHVVAVGERFAGYQVARIDARGVLLTRAGRELLLTMQDKETP